MGKTKSLIHRPSVKHATAINIISILFNIAVGLALIPLINNKISLNATSIYFAMMAVKSMVDVFTSAAGGAVIRIMIDGGFVRGYALSRKVYLLYISISVPIAAAVISFAFNVSADMFLPFAAVIAVNLFMQPRLQMVASLGYQQIGAIVRITTNFIYFAAAVIYLYASPAASLFGVYAAQLMAYVVGFFVVIFIYKTLAAGIDEKTGSQLGPSEYRKLVKKTITFYSLFAAMMALSFQVDATLLYRLVPSGLFVALMVAWKVPNIIIQVFWRFSEVQGLYLKTQKGTGVDLRKKSLLKKELIIIFLAVLAAIIYFIFGKLIINIWMGREIAESLSYKVLAVFSVGIPVLTLNRFYTASLQYTDRVSQLAAQYFLIVLAKSLSIVLLASIFPYISFAIWFFMEFLFLIRNRKVFYGTI